MLVSIETKFLGYARELDEVITEPRYRKEMEAKAYCSTCIDIVLRIVENVYGIALREFE